LDDVESLVPPLTLRIRPSILPFIVMVLKSIARTWHCPSILHFSLMVLKYLV